MNRKILHIITTSNPHGGAQKVLLNHVALCKDYQNTVLVGSAGILTDELAQLDVEVIISKYLKRNYSFLDIFFMTSLYFQLRKFNYDLVVSHSSKAGLLVRIVCWLRQQSNLFVVHGWSFSNNTNWLKGKFYFSVEKFASLFSDNLLFVSYYDRDIAHKLGIGTGSNNEVIWNGCQPQELSSNTYNDNVTNLVFVARLSEQKDHRTLINAVALLEKKVQEKIRIRCIGGGDLMNELQELVNHFGLNNSFEFLGELRVLDEHYKWAKFSVLISNYEGFPLVNVESFSFGVPVIASNVGGVSEIVKNSETGYLVERGDIEGLSDLINKLVRIQHTEYIELVQNVKRLHEESLTETVISSKTINYLEKCIYQN